MRTLLTLAAGAIVTLASSSTDMAYPINLTVDENATLATIGNKSNINHFTNNLIDNIGSLLGSKPYIRVGGNTQDFALYDASLPTAIRGSYDKTRSLDYPTTVRIGPSFFESYAVLPAGVRLSHGFNLALGATTAEGWQTLLDTAPLACRALGRDRFYAYEYGNEPNLYSRRKPPGSAPARPPVRGAGWAAADYVAEWLNGTRAIRRQMERHCPELSAAYREFLAPSFDDRNHVLDTMDVWKLGLNKRGNIKAFSVHNYISGAGSPGVTLQHTLMNHSMTTRDIDQQLAVYKDVVAAGERGFRQPPLIMGEANSLYDQGRPGLSNTFGAALWALDFVMYAASAGYERVHLHQGTNYRYQSWQPIDTAKTVKGTKAPYYGNIAAAAALSSIVDDDDGGSDDVRVSSIRVPSDTDALYAVYVGARLRRILAINMRGHNTTRHGAGLEPLPPSQTQRRRSRCFSLSLLSSSSSAAAAAAAAARVVDVHVQRLSANGSDAVDGISFDGWSYDWDQDGGRPVRLRNVTTTGATDEMETVTPDGEGVVSVQVPDSSAALLTVRWAKVELRTNKTNWPI